MICDCCRQDKKDTRARVVTDIEHGRKKQPNLCDMCNAKIHNPALRDQQFNDWIERLFNS